MINNICEFKERCDFINDLIVKEYNKGRKILILNDRRGYLENTKKWLNNSSQKKIVQVYMLVE